MKYEFGKNQSFCLLYILWVSNEGNIVWKNEYGFSNIILNDRTISGKFSVAFFGFINNKFERGVNREADNEYCVWQDFVGEKN